MPKKTAPKMIQTVVSIPAPLYEAAKRVQVMEGWNESEMHRVFWEKGFAVHIQATLARYQMGLITSEQGLVE
ncbi:hypothetical protein LC605_25915 [Nostoc sp. CHAB 5836]|uniref:hypothetical protein n=1 Tax=Nostoc sp. CHAB 5836 TaxID=2780404 RepID=UPI001E3CF7C3|nr:hypothetical protein [Nostoc sp. CHAB 5836]MCC5618460.1 hypothetical protein [Nostoc sp. CHAB 5836]